MFVKICGVTSEEDALLAVAMGADAVGFNFVPGSKRLIAPQKAADIVKRLPHEILTVGIFRDEPPERVVEITWASGLRAAQLHGRETPADTRFVRSKVPFVIKALTAGHPSVERADEYGADVVMLDAATPGGGHTFDWSLASAADVDPLLLAGGLDPDNVADAVRAVRPWGVDVATGVESAPGRKDPRKLAAFIDAARNAEEIS